MLYFNLWAYFCEMNSIVSGYTKLSDSSVWYLYPHSPFWNEEDITTWVQGPLSVNKISLQIIAFFSIYNLYRVPTFLNRVVTLFQVLIILCLGRYDPFENLLTFFILKYFFKVFFFFKGVNQRSVILYQVFFLFLLFPIFCSCNKYNMAAVLQSLTD